MATPPTVNDWIDKDFPNVDFTRHHDDLADGITPDEDDILHPEVVINVAPAEEPAPAPAPVVAQQPEPEEAEEPEAFDLPGGGQGSIEKTKKGWRVTIDVGVGGVQNFYGKTKNEAMVNMAVAQANATRKIRDLNRQVKLGVTSDSSQPVIQAAQTAGRTLTEDEIFDLKTKLASNPDLALDEWVKKRHGVDLGQLAQLARKGADAARELGIEATHKEFLARCPAWYPDAGFENYTTLVSYLAKHKLGRALTDGNKHELVRELYDRGFYTVENLEEGFAELNDSGLLLRAPLPKETKETPAQPEAVVTAPARPNERIVRTETRPRAGLGIRNSEVSSTTPPAAPAKKPLSAEDLENLTDEQIEKLIAMEKNRIRSSRR